jgi:cellobiose phosphorylase
MLYGFLGFHPTADGCRIEPSLPKDWPSLTITRIHLQDQVLDISADSATKTISIKGIGADDSAKVETSPGWKVVKIQPQ